uniref:Coenzyme Q-binding protein COQ10 START domain-containing protein n=1 Tax=Haptolina brevifila TaxID=156173 RepID=A0A7S2IIZ1_9EUKA|mmetsp:Transcript_66449/g.131751  ORF Transcript_66449/g.131751 Transcript_66449/m.131751 type:complete len:276 (+) Transcript_66449:65-892(+)|eukprot:CAMPEP_0174733756 /NCGR_PEP_ID=MMETSP1094-20130205/61964_1 /TAXON_ID=156173 /ORGANISM="Chrysochromulina brevifilum, Strain UTEX LB 985" /LENGTH=275 /DNA_ID=CAMNT_0015936457 /DNA_START=63 /DNA_END=890 /DNA_ORIENTATION=-
MTRVLFLLLLANVPAASAGADATKPHAHQGILRKYERLPPSKVGISMAGVSNEELRQGQPVLRMMKLPGGFQRIVSVQDIHAPESVVFGAIMDLANYPKMVDGVTICEPYSETKSRMSGEVIVCAKYKITAAGFGITYFIKHVYEPSKHCMTFHLDYERCSELSDTAGYWYVEQLKEGWCRLYYSSESQMPALIPTFMKTALTNLAAKRSTAWVETRCNQLTGYKPGGRATAGGAGGKLKVHMRGMMTLLLLVVAAQRLPLPKLALPRPWAVQAI